jgi:hypothetical protein
MRPTRRTVVLAQWCGAGVLVSLVPDLGDLPGWLAVTCFVAGGTLVAIGVIITARDCFRRPASR